VIKKEKILSDDESKDESKDTDEKSSNTNDDGKNISIINKQVTSKPVAYDDVKKKLMEKYSEMVSNKNTFEDTQGSWYTLKFYTMKETSAANYYLVEMEFSNNNQDPMKQLNICFFANSRGQIHLHLLGITDDASIINKKLWKLRRQNKRN